MNQSSDMSGESRRASKKFVVLLVVCIFVGGGALYYWWTSKQLFDARYADYIAAAGEYTRTAYVPAAEENPIRQEVNGILSRVLVQAMTAEERLELSKKGLQHLQDIDGQIDAIGVAGEQASSTLAVLEKSLPLVRLFGVGSEIANIETLAIKRAQLIADIRGLSYRANFHTAEIFNQIISDNGSLTDTHTTLLNELVPELEAQFDRRTNLYAELEATDARAQMLEGD